MPEGARLLSKEELEKVEFIERGATYYLPLLSMCDPSKGSVSIL